MTTPTNPTIPYGYCHCGCGQKTTLSVGTNAKRGLLKGLPIHYLPGHFRKVEVQRKTLNSYITWTAMKQRCLNQKHPFFFNYGGRGIEICERWRYSFEAFLEDMGPRPPGMTIERKDSDGNYEPGNCRWATRKEQNNNTKTNRIICYNGKSYTVAQLAEEYGLKPSTAYYRLNLGWSIEDVIFKRVGYRNAIQS